ncbi:protein PHYTOCHROME KINASE SUBSTRATE 4 [Rhodamnia argentea]|uniref:Protein PHYTOCHROME KINASE SUBSTRATE 4 n=1 Tax=Rhodamnia argentea TaxID=178133 RepID=A0A8B8N7A6_9MYRT|nr:protein PHYTOCHROME KINASE SUBSTRATE 4 [Rhodamnia argentea]
MKAHSSASFERKPNLSAAATADFSFSSYRRPPSDDEEPKRPSREHNQIAADDSELSIFDARKYFNETNDQEFANGARVVSPLKENLPDPSLLLPRLSSASLSIADGYGRNYRARSFRSYVTPTASSEASWNSRTGLLSNPPGAISVSLRDPVADRKRGTSSNSARWLLFQQKCPCLGKKSVRVKERSTEPRSPARLSNYRPKELAVYKVQPDIAKTKAFSITAVSETSKTSLVATTTPRYYMSKTSEQIPNSIRRISTEAENCFPPEVHASVVVPGRPFVDGTTNAGFTFPVLNPSMSSSSSSPPLKPVPNGQSSIKKPISPLLPLALDPPRESLEVFQPSRPSNPRPCQLLVTPAGLGPRENQAADDEAASDASSDLFEIESFSTQSTSYPIPYHRQRDSLDEARPRFSTNTSTGPGLYNGLDDQPMTPSSSGYALTECGYEPSEASIAWSVTTAEGTAWDWGSVTNYSVSASDVEEFTRMQLRLHQEQERGGGGEGGGGRRRGNGLLMSCRCEKAVSVGPSPVKCMPERGHVHGHGHGQGHHKSRPSPSLPAPANPNALARHVSSRPPPVANKPPVPSSHSARLSLTFVT